MPWLTNAHKISINQFALRHSILYLSSVLKSECAHVLLKEDWTIHFPSLTVTRQVVEPLRKGSTIQIIFCR